MRQRFEMIEMAIISIDGKEYDTDHLSDEAKN